MHGTSTLAQRFSVSTVVWGVPCRNISDSGKHCPVRFVFPPHFSILHRRRVLIHRVVVPPRSLAQVRINSYLRWPPDEPGNS